MFFFGRNKFKKIKREDIVDAICEINKQQDELERSIIDKSSRIKELMEKGKSEQNRDMRLFYAKKISAMQAEIRRDTKRNMYLMQNVKNLDNLKAAIDDNAFIANNTKLPLNKLLNNPAELNKFLQDVLSTKNEAEQSLVDANQAFEDYEKATEERSEIYGVSESDDDLLAMFETEDQLDSEAGRVSEPAVATPKKEAQTDV